MASGLNQQGGDCFLCQITVKRQARGRLPSLALRTLPQFGPKIATRTLGALLGLLGLLFKELLHDVLVHPRRLTGSINSQ